MNVAEKVKKLWDNFYNKLLLLLYRYDYCYSLATTAASTTAAAAAAAAAAVVWAPLVHFFGWAHIVALVSSLYQ